MPLADGSALTRFLTRLVIALVLAGSVVGVAVVMVNATIDKELARIPRVDVNTVAPSADGANYLVVGSDSRAFVDTAGEVQAFGGNETGRRSDTMMIVHVAPGGGQTLVVSFPRDLWVDIPGIGNAKINAAFNEDLVGDGPNSVIATLKQNFDIDINHYVEVDFRTFASMVDAVGSVPIYVDRPVVDDFTGFVAVEPGCYALDGREALAWVRSRHLRFLNPATGRVEEEARADIGRIDRQQDFIRRLAGIVVERSVADPRRGRDIVHGVVGDLRVDRGFDRRAAFDLISAFRSISSDDTSALEFVTFPFTSGNADGQAVLFPDVTSGGPVLDRLRTFGPVPAAPVVRPADVRVRVLNGSGRAGLAEETMDALVSAGFVKGGTGNDVRGRVAVTEVRYANGAEAKAQLVLGAVGEGVKLVGDPTLDDADVVVVLGADFVAPKTDDAGSGTGSAPAPSGTAPAEVAAACR